jgi:hypothetical protein
MRGSGRVWEGIIAAVAIIVIVVCAVILIQRTQNAPAPAGETSPPTVETTNIPESTVAAPARTPEF